MPDIDAATVSQLKTELLSREEFLGAIIEVDQAAAAANPSRQEPFDLDVSAALTPRFRAISILQRAKERHERP